MIRNRANLSGSKNQRINKTPHREGFFSLETMVLKPDKKSGIDVKKARSIITLMSLLRKIGKAQYIEVA